MKIYLASSWRNTYHASVLDMLRTGGHEVYDFKKPAPGKTGFSWEQTINRPIYDGNDLLEALAHPRAVEGFKYDFDAMKAADMCVLLLPCGNSAHLEAGWFIGSGKPIVVLCPELREPELMYKLAEREGFTPLTPLFVSPGPMMAHLYRLHRSMAEARGVPAEMIPIPPEAAADHLPFG